MTKKMSKAFQMTHFRKTYQLPLCINIDGSGTKCKFINNCQLIDTKIESCKDRNICDPMLYSLELNKELDHLWSIIDKFCENMSSEMPWPTAYEQFIKSLKL
jgi:hypothetical protein